MRPVAVNGLTLYDLGIKRAGLNDFVVGREVDRDVLYIEGTAFSMSWLDTRLEYTLNRGREWIRGKPSDSEAQTGIPVRRLPNGDLMYIKPDENYSIPDEVLDRYRKK